MNTRRRPGATTLSFVTAGLVAVGAANQEVAGRKPALPEANDRTVTHVLNRLTFGPRPGDVAAVRSMGLEAYIESQLHPERIDDRALDARLASFTTINLSTRELSERYFAPLNELRLQQARERQQTPGGTPRIENQDSPAIAQPPPELRQAMAASQQVTTELMQAKLLRAALSERQLQEVLTDFWFNHFNVFVGKGPVRQYLPAYERDVIRPHVLGRFRDLLGAVAHSPAMLIYLDNWQSAAPATNVRRPALVRRPNAAGRPPALPRAMPPAGQPVPGRPTRGLNENYARELMELHTLGVDGGYTQDDVVALARIFTGWTVELPRQGGGFVFRPAMHDNGTKTLLGKTFQPSGESEGERALDLLAQHPATARHIAYKLAQRFVADEPPAALVDRAARTFTASRGDLREVVRVIVTSPELFAPEAHRARVKTPLEFVVSAVRATGATVNSALPLVAALRTLGMPLYGSQPPTGYDTTADAWVNTGALLNRMNFAVSLVGGGGRRGLTVDRPIDVDLGSFAPDASDASARAVVERLLGGDASPSTRATLARAETPAHLVALALGSPEFQRR